MFGKSKISGLLKFDGMYHYYYDDDGNLIKRTINEDTVTDEYSYDQKGRLDAVVNYKNVGLLGMMIETRHEYLYDDDDNLLVENIYRRYDEEDTEALFLSGKHEYTYDAQGNQVSHLYYIRNLRPDKTETEFLAMEETFAYDNNNQLVSRIKTENPG